MEYDGTPQGVTAVGLGGTAVEAAASGSFGESTPTIDTGTVGGGSSWDAADEVLADDSDDMGGDPRFGGLSDEDWKTTAGGGDVEEVPATAHRRPTSALPVAESLTGSVGLPAALTRASR